MASLRNSTKCTKEFTSIFLKISQKTEEKGTLWMPFYEATITLIPKPDKMKLLSHVQLFVTPLIEAYQVPPPDKDTTKNRKLKTNIFDEYRCKNSQENIMKPNATTH